MSRDFNPTLNSMVGSLFVVAGLVAWLGAHPEAANADAGDAANDTYTWSAELVALDEAAGTVTVKSRVVQHADAGNLSELAEGDRVVITWSGLTWAAGIRGLTPEGDTELGRFMLPVEFVSSEMDGQYITFRVPVPSPGLEKIRSLSPGEWVTLTSPHEPSGSAEAVVDVRPYNDVA